MLIASAFALNILVNFVMVFVLIRASSERRRLEAQLKDVERCYKVLKNRFRPTKHVVLINGRIIPVYAPIAVYEAKGNETVSKVELGMNGSDKYRNIAMTHPINMSDGDDLIIDLEVGCPNG